MHGAVQKSSQVKVRGKPEEGVALELDAEVSLEEPLQASPEKQENLSSEIDQLFDIAFQNSLIPIL